ncbi:hypothetical protein BLS_004645 [Venturia inaequalis]|uniref:Uncharacterized protein n=1 Tax=Venturia inaequalis TaxID=5025 RepID=A0A8H3YT76_VENIN|nr:hypothetical protein BLS_004645 [Venturia inaequalis]
MAEKMDNAHKEHISQASGGSASPDSLYFENPKLREISHGEAYRQPAQLIHQSTVETLREHGAPIDHIVPQANSKASGPDLWWSKVRAYMQEPFSEFFGCFIMILFGWGLGVMLGVYAGGKSGGHLNPAVTFANCVFRKFPWRKFPVYLISQVLGCMCASAVVYGNYKSAIDVYEGGANIRTVPGFSNHSTAGIFCTYPAEFLTRTGQFFSEIVASTILIFCIYALKDDGNIGAGNLTPLALFFVIFGIGACFGWETGYAINLARDFGPRLMSYFLGYGHEVWSAGNYYFWIPMVAPFFGCTFGGFLYDVFIYTGESPINTPWMGLRRLLRPTRKEWSNTMV